MRGDSRWERPTYTHLVGRYAREEPEAEHPRELPIHVFVASLQARRPRKSARVGGRGAAVWHRNRNRRGRCPVANGTGGGNNQAKNRKVSGGVRQRSPSHERIVGSTHTGSKQQKQQQRKACKGEAVLSCTTMYSITRVSAWGMFCHATSYLCVQDFLTELYDVSKISEIFCIRVNCFVDFISRIATAVCYL